MSEESSHNLPGVITSISVQKNNKERYSIFVDEEFLIGISESTLIELELAKGVEMTPLLFRKVQRHEGRFTVKSYLIKLLGRRDHARKELLTKALKKGHTKEVVVSVLDELQQKGYIDEESFARKFAADKSSLNRWGPSKIKAHLIKKGIDRQIIDKSIEETFRDFELKETFLNLVLKKKRRFLREEDLIKRKKKIFDHLVRKGYKPNSVFKHMDELMEAVAE